jgi:hypothetical protein
MKADRVEVSWDDQKSKWLVRIVVGEEVIRRYSGESKSAGQDQLRSAATQIVTDEGYQVDGSEISLH